MIKVELPEEIKTERFSMEKISMKDKSSWMEFIQSQEALKFISFIRSTEQACEDWILRQMERYDNNEGGLYGMYTAKGELIGQCGLLLQEIDGKEELEIGYHVMPEYWNNGYAFEAANAWKNYAFQNRINNSLISMIHTGNIASQEVAKKNGMTLEKETFYKDLPVGIYRITYADWLQEQDPEVIA
ncbi:MAG: GNAT family N-acetyltransferase [Bacteroidota bacterium]